MFSHCVCVCVCVCVCHDKMSEVQGLKVISMGSPCVVSWKTESD